MYRSFDVYGQEIHDIITGEVVSIELLARPKDGHIIDLDEYFHELDPAIAFQWFLHQRKIARRFYRATRIPCSINIDRHSLAYLKEYGPKYDEGIEYSIEITQLYSLPEALSLDKVFKSRGKNIEIWLDDYDVDSILNVDDLLGTYDFDVVKLDPKTPKLLLNDLGRTKLKLFNKLINKSKAKVIVEGTETEKQVNEFVDLGFRYYQGFFFHRPEHIDVLTEKHRIIKDESNTYLEF